MTKFPVKRKPSQTFDLKYAYVNCIKTQQTPEALPLFKKFLTTERFDTVIELGTHRGGFAIFLSDIVGPLLHTFDIHDTLTLETKEYLNKNNSNFYFENVFTSEKVLRLIKRRGRCLLLCDNGNKPKEAKLFTPYLKKNDIIMMHDYFSTVEDYHSQNKWKACEITEDCIDQNMLITYEPYSSEFKKVFWACRRRV